MEPTWKTYAQMESNIKTDLEEIILEVLTVVNLAEDRHKWFAVLHTVMNLLFHAVPDYLDWLRK